MTGVQWVPAVGQSVEGAAVQLPLTSSQRQTGRQLSAPPFELQMNPGAQLAELVQASPSCPIREASGQAQSTSSMPGMRQASPTGHPLLLAVAAAAVGSQLNVQMRDAAVTPGQIGSRQTLPGPAPPAPKEAQSASPPQKRRQILEAHPMLV